MAGKKKDNTMMWLLGIAGVGALYYFIKNKVAAAPVTTAASALPVSPLPLPLPPVTAAPAAAPVTTIVSPITQTTAATPPPLVAQGAPTNNMPTMTQMNTLNAWAQSTMNACDLGRWNANMASFTPDEWAGLVDLYFTDWTGGQGNTPERTAFWDNWRGKYSILTNTPC